MSTDRLMQAGAMSGVSTNSFIISDTPTLTKRRRVEASTTPERQLDTRQVQLGWQMLTHRFVRACMNEIAKRLFSGRGIAVQRGDEPQIPTDAFERFLRRDMLPFARDAINCIMVLGIVPIAFRKSNGLGPDELAPFVPPPNQYVITTWSDAGVQRYSFYWSSNGIDIGEEDDTVYIAHDFEAEPMLDGTLTSNIASLIPELLLSNELIRLMLKAEQINANPQLVLGYNIAVDAAARAASQQAGEFAGDIDACQHRADFLYERNAEMRETTANNLRAWQQATGIDARTAFGELGASLLNNTHDAYTNAPVVEDRGVPEHRLRVTDTVVAQRAAHARTDYVQLMDQIMMSVCRVMNVPEGALASSSSVKAGVEATAESMHRTINHYADMLSSLMTAVYNHLFLVRNLDDELRSRVERKRKSPLDLAPQLITEQDLFEAYQATRVRLSLDLPPTTSVETLHDLRNRRLISYRTYGEAVLRLEGFPAAYLDSLKDPFTAEERKEMLMSTATKRQRRD